MLESWFFIGVKFDQFLYIFLCFHLCIFCFFCVSGGFAISFLTFRMVGAANPLNSLSFRLNILTHDRMLFILSTFYATWNHFSIDALHLMLTFSVIICSRYLPLLFNSIMFKTIATIQSRFNSTISHKYSQMKWKKKEKRKKEQKQWITERHIEHGQVNWVDLKFDRYVLAVV